MLGFIQKYFGLGVPPAADQNGIERGDKEREGAKILGFLPPLGGYSNLRR
jgi:hypothetical protein